MHAAQIRLRGGWEAGNPSAPELEMRRMVLSSPSGPEPCSSRSACLSPPRISERPVRRGFGRIRLHMLAIAVPRRPFSAIQLVRATTYDLESVSRRLRSAARARLAPRRTSIRPLPRVDVR
jgi:hypothetical protein